MRKSALSDIFAGLIVLAIGLSFFLAANNIIPWDKWWSYLLTFLGVTFIFDAILRNLKLKERLIGSRFVAGVIILCIGFAFVFALKNWWPLILIVVGVLIIIKGIASPKEETRGEST